MVEPAVPPTPRTEELKVVLVAVPGSGIELPPEAVGPVAAAMAKVPAAAAAVPSIQEQTLPIAPVPIPAKAM